MFLEFVFNCVISNDDSLIGIALDTIGAIALSNEGLAVLFQTESHRNVVANIGSCLRSAEEQLRYTLKLCFVCSFIPFFLSFILLKLLHKSCCNIFFRVHCMDCLASVFASDQTCDKNVLDLIHILYLKLASNPLELLFRVLKQPFQKVRKPCLKTFHSLVSYEWMLEDTKNIPGNKTRTLSDFLWQIFIFIFKLFYYFNINTMPQYRISLKLALLIVAIYGLKISIIFPGFLEFLLDRTTENEKECQELKYEVIKKMACSPCVSLVFDKPLVLKLKQFVRDGPFFVGSDVSVAMEGTQ